MRGFLILSLIFLVLASACDGTDTDTGDGFWEFDVQDARRAHIQIRGPWEQVHTGSGRERHVVRAKAKLRPSDHPTAVQVDFEGAGYAQVLLLTGDGWVVASCGGQIESDSLVCLSTATPHGYSGTPRVEVWTHLNQADRPTPISGHIRLGAH